VNTGFDPSGGQSVRKRSKWFWIGPVASILIFSVSLAVLWHILKELKPDELWTAFSSAGRTQLWQAAGLVCLSYLLLTGYDALALKRLGLRIPYRTTALASYTSYSVSFTLGFPLVTGGTVRYWLYAPRGIRAAEVASLTVIAGITFWLGMGIVLSALLFYTPTTIAGLARTTAQTMQLSGAALASIVLAYLFWVSSAPRAIQVRGWRLELPGFGVTLGQMILGAGDVCAAGAVLYVLLPAGHAIAYETFLAAYIFAALIGIASHAPGGLGVFEATMLVALSEIPREQVLGALLLFRIFYYLVPFMIALALLGLYEITRQIRRKPQ
jgi:glycosyltransferase 2 family protein